MYKYGIDWAKENAVDGGFLDDRIVRMVLYYFDDLDINRKEMALEQNPDAFNSIIFNAYIHFDDISNTYYLVLPLSPARRSSKSTIMLTIESDILDKKIEEIVELPKIIDATVGEVRLVIPTNIKKKQDRYEVNIKFKDSEREEYKNYEENNQTNKLRVKNHEKNIIYDKDNILVEYGYVDYTWDVNWKRIEGIEPYKNEEGIWTSDVVKYPEKYLESHLDYYYSDERMVDYIEARGLLPQYKIDAIRAANYEDIFSLEYRLKQAVKILPIILFIIIAAVILLKKYKKKIFKPKSSDNA